MSNSLQKFEIPVKDPHPEIRIRFEKIAVNFDNEEPLMNWDRHLALACTTRTTTRTQDARLDGFRFVGDVTAH